MVGNKIKRTKKNSQAAESASLSIDSFNEDFNRPAAQDLKRQYLKMLLSMLGKNKQFFLPMTLQDNQHVLTALNLYLTSY